MPRSRRRSAGSAPWIISGLPFDARGSKKTSLPVLRLDLPARRCIGDRQLDPALVTRYLRRRFRRAAPRGERGLVANSSLKKTVFHLLTGFATLPTES